jgi:hypothetical protein
VEGLQGTAGGWAVIDPAFACSIRTTETQNGATQVRTAAQLQNMALRLDGNYAITRSIDLSGITLVPIGTADAPFTGTVNGNGSQGIVISNYTAAQTAGSTGLFGVLQSAALQDIVLQNASITVEQAADDVDTPTYNVGVLVGEMDSASALDACQVLDATVRIHIETGTNTSKATLAFGALAGRSDGTIRNCIVTGLQAVYTVYEDANGTPAGPEVQAYLNALVGVQTDGVLENNTGDTNSVTVAEPTDGALYAVQPNSVYTLDGTVWTPDTTETTGNAPTEESVDATEQIEETEQNTEAFNSSSTSVPVDSDDVPQQKDASTQTVQEEAAALRTARKAATAVQKLRRAS